MPPELSHACTQAPEVLNKIPSFLIRARGSSDSSTTKRFLFLELFSYVNWEQGPEVHRIFFEQRTFKHCGVTAHAGDYENISNWQPVLGGERDKMKWKNIRQNYIVLHIRIYFYFIEFCFQLCIYVF